MTYRPYRVLLILALSVLPLQLGAELHAQTNLSSAPAQARYREGELLVKFRDSSTARAAKVHSVAHTQRLGRFGRLEHVRLAAGFDLAAMQRWYQAQPDVEYAEPNYIVHKAAVPTDTHFNFQWGLRNSGQNVNGTSGTAGADINAAPAWDKHTGDGSVVVALVDTGVDYTHPDLAANIWSNPNDASDGIDNDSNGKVDDIRGWDFANNDADPMDDDVDGHGSHVAGIVGAVGNNAAGVSGVNWNVKLMPLKVLRADGFGDIASIVAAFDYAIAQGVSIINGSYAYDCGDALSQSERDALERARAAGILVVLAAGNDGCDNDARPTNPASHALNNLLSVGASDQFDQRASFVRGGSSNYGAQSVHLFAPGRNIYSTLRVTLGSYGYENGTSMAAPFVSGAAALLKSYRPALNLFQVREILLKTAAAKPALAGLAVTGGRLDIGAAMAYDLATSTPIQPSHLQAVRVNDSRIDLSWLDDSTIENGWKLEYRSSPEQTVYSQRATLASATLSYQDSAVQAGEGTYNGYRVTAYNGYGDTTPTAEVKLVNPPLAPNNLRASGTGSTLTVTWSDRSTRESDYRLERASEGGLFNEIATLPANTAEYVDSGLTLGTEYRYRARAYSAVAGYSDYSAAAVITPQESNGGTHAGCFIATAAYGSALHPKVHALRLFRDRFLNTNAPGRAFVAAYYHLSPPLADFIAHHDWLRAGVRTLLWPLVWLADTLIPNAEAGAFFHPAQSQAEKTAAADKVSQELSVERQLLVKFTPAVDATAAQTLLLAQGAQRVEAISPQLYLAEFADLAARMQAQSALNQAPQVEYVEPNRRVSRPRTP